MAINKYNMDMCKGPIGIKMIRFAIPLALTYILQLTFHAADLMIIGRFGSAESMAAIGTTMDLNTLMLNLLTGISMGSNVVAAQYYGAKDSRNVNRTVHTSMAFSLLGGTIVALFGFIFCRDFLEMMDVPHAILPKSVLYLRIIFLGMPCAMLYNYGCAFLRAIGDTKRPLLFLIIAGMTNVLLNMLFVIVFKWDIAGVAIATILSQILSAYLIINVLTKMRGACRLVFRFVRLDLPVLKKMLYIGVPAGLQGMMFSFANVIIQKAINSFGPQAMAGMTATGCLEWILYSGIYACHQTSTAFVGQNYGGKKPLRIIRSIWWGLGIVTVISLTLGLCMFMTGENLIGLFRNDPEVIEWGMKRIRIVFVLYFLCGWMDVISGALRGLGYSILPTIVILLGVCVFRILWIAFIFPEYRTITVLIMAYPITWLTAVTAEGVILYFVCKKLLSRGKLISLH